MSKPQKQTYRAKNGNTQYRPSIELAMLMDEENEGFCLCCGEVHEGIEPDARRYTCEACGQDKVYGAAELVLMGLVF